MRPTHFSRRAFLQAAAAAPLLAAPPAGPNLHFPSEPRQRLSVTSYPFRAYIESPTNPERDKSKPGMDLKEFPAMIAKRFGVPNINPLGNHMSSTDPAYLESFRKAVADAGSHIVDLGLSGRDFSHPDRAVQDEAVAYGRKWIDIAAQLGSPSVRQHLQTAAGATPSAARAVIHDKDGELVMGAPVTWHIQALLATPGPSASVPGADYVTFSDVCTDPATTVGPQRARLTASVGGHTASKVLTWTPRAQSEPREGWTRDPECEGPCGCDTGTAENAGGAGLLLAAALLRRRSR